MKGEPSEDEGEGHLPQRRESSQGVLLTQDRKTKQGGPGEMGRVTDRIAKLERIVWEEKDFNVEG